MERDNTREECIYEGHRICVEAEALPSGAWNWRYVVLGSLIASFSGDACLTDPATALRQGMAAARARVRAAGSSG